MSYRNETCFLPKMPKETSFQVSVFIETKLTTSCQIDNGSEASLAKSFLLKNWDINKTNISMIGITSVKERLLQVSKSVYLSQKKR